MDIPVLETFVAIAETGSFSLAAERLHRSQPAISKRIAALEAHVGNQLFDRIGRKVRLTEAGEKLLPHARHILNAVEESRRALTNLSDTVEGRLSIGTSHHVGLHRLPPLLREFVQQYPQVDLDLHFMDSEQACHDVEHGRLELAVITLPPQPPTVLEHFEVWRDPMQIVAAADHPLAQLETVRAADLNAHPAVLPDETTYTRDIVLDALAKVGVHPQVRLAINYMETLKMLAAIGLGWTALPESMIDKNLKQLRLGRLEIRRSLGVIRHPGRSLSNAGRQLVRQLQLAAD